MATVEIPADWGVRCEQDGGNYSTSSTISYYQGYAGNTADVAWRFRVQPSDVPAAAIANVTKVEFKAYINNFGTGYSWDGSSMLVPVDMTVNYDATNGFTNGANRPNVVFDAQSSTAVNEKSLGTVITDSTNGSYTNGNTYFEIDDGTDFAAALADAVANRGAYASNYVDIGVILHATQTQVNAQCQFQNYSAANPPYIRITYTEGPQDRFLDGTSTGTGSLTGTPSGPTKNVFILDGTGAPTSGALSSPTGVDTSGEVDAYSVSGTQTWAEETTSSYSDNDRRWVIAQNSQAYVQATLTGHMGDVWAARWYSNKGDTGAITNNIFAAYNSSSGAIFLLQVDLDDQVNILTQGTGGSNGVGTSSLSSWTRFELKCSGTTASDTVTLQLYNSAGNIIETIGPATIGTVSGGQEIDFIRIGNISGSNNAFLSSHSLQNLVIQSGGDGDYVGPWIAFSTYNLDGTSTGSGTSSATLQVEKLVSGTSTGTATADATNNFSVAGTKLVDGTSTGSGTSSGTYVYERDLAGTSSGLGTTNGPLLVGIDTATASYEWHTDQTGTFPRRGVLASPAYDANSRNLDIYYPDSGVHGTGPYPVFVWVHGGNWYKNVDKKSILQAPSASDSDNGAALAMLEDLLDNGWAVVSMDYRQVQGGGTPVGPNSDILQWPDQLDDVRLAVSWLKNSGDSATDSLDMSRWALGGHSAGAYLALTAGFLPTRTNADGGGGNNYYQQFATEGATTYNYNTSDRYAPGGAWDVDDDMAPMAIAVWDPPVDLKWATLQEPNDILANAAGSADMSVRGLIGDDSRFDDGSADVPAAKLEFASISTYDDYGIRTVINTSPWITSDAPALIAFGQGSPYANYDRVYNFLATSNDGTTSTSGTNAGHIYFLKYHYQQAGIDGRFEEHFGQGGVAGHDDINDYLGDTGTEFITFMNAVLQLQLQGTVSGSGTADATGNLVVTETEVMDGTSTGSGSSSAGIQVEKLVAGTSSGSGSSTAGLQVDRVQDGVSTGSAVATGTFSTTTVHYLVQDGTYGGTYGGLYGEGSATTSGAGSSSATLQVEKLVAGTSSGSGTSTAGIQVDRVQDSVSTGFAVVTGTFSNTTVHYLVQDGYGGTYGGLYGGGPATSTGTGAVSGSLYTDRYVNGTAAGIGVSTAAGNLITTGTRLLDGTSTGTASVDATNNLVVSGTQLVNGTSFGLATSSAGIQVEKFLSGTSTGTAAADATNNLTIGGTRLINGTSSGTATSTAGLQVEKLLSGTSTGLGTADAAGNLIKGGTKVTDGTSTGAGITSGTLQIEKTLDGTSTGAGTADATNNLVLGGTQLVNGTSTGTSLVSGALSTDRFLDGTVSGAASTDATLVSSAIHALDGTSTGSAAVAGVPETDKTLVGASSGAALVSGNISVSRDVSGTASGSGTTIGNLGVAGTHVVDGTSTGSSSSSGLPQVNKLLSGSAQGAGSAAGAFQISSGISGASLGTAVVSGFFSMERSVDGAASGSASVKGVLTRLAIEYWVVGDGDTLVPVTPSYYVHDNAGTPELRPISELSYLFTVGVDGP